MNEPNAARGQALKRRLAWAGLAVAGYCLFQAGRWWSEEPRVLPEIAPRSNRWIAIVAPSGEVLSEWQPSDGAVYDALEEALLATLRASKRGAGPIPGPTP